MSLISKEIEKLTSHLNNRSNWNDSNLNSFVESLLHESLKTPVRSVHHSEKCLALYVDLKKELNAGFRECLIFLIAPVDEVNPEIISGIYEDMNQALFKEGLSSQPHLIFLFGENDAQYKAISEKFGSCFIADTTELEKIALSPGPRQAIIKSLKLHGVNMAECPFHYLSPCNPEIFMGRAKHIKDVLLGHQGAFAIYGGRRIGKTSLLLKILNESKKKKCSKKNYYPLYIDCSNISSFQILSNEITRRLFPQYYYDITIKAA